MAKIASGAVAARARGSAWPAISWRTVRSTVRGKSHCSEATKIAPSAVAASEASPGCTMTRIGSFALPASRDIAETSDPGCVVSQLRTRSPLRRPPRVDSRLARLGGGPREGQRMGRRLVAHVVGRGPQEALPRQHAKLRRSHRADNRGLEAQLARPIGVELTERRDPLEKLGQPFERDQELGGELDGVVRPPRGARRPAAESP